MGVESKPAKRAYPLATGAGRVATAGFLAVACVGVGARASDDQTREHRVEVQINLCSEPHEIIDRLALEPSGAKSVEAWYFETANLDLFRRGLVFRLRLKPKESELTLKVADQDCSRVDPSLISENGKCEYDLHGASLKGAVSLSTALDERTVSDLLARRSTLNEALSPSQIRYLRESVRAWPLPDAIEPLGPVRIQTYPSPNQGFVVEMWRLPSGRRFIEISRKADSENALRRSAELAEKLAQAGVQLCTDQASQAGAKLEDLLRGARPARRAGCPFGWVRCG